MRIAITGGAGFIGANLAAHLVGQGAEVRVLDDLSTGSLSNLEGIEVDFTEGSVLDEQDLKCLRGADAIVHLAAVPSVPRSVKDPFTSHEVNATGTLRVLQSARADNSYVIVASSSSVYGANPELPKVETMRPRPVSPYAVSKLAAESYSISFQRVYDLPTLAFRFFNVFGPLQAPGHAYAAVVPAFTFAAISAQPLIVHGDGTQTRDFTFVGSVTETISTAVEHRITSLDPVNLAFGSRFSLLEVIEMIESESGVKTTRQHSEPRAGDVQDSQADSNLVRRLFPEVMPVAFEEGLRRTIEWMRRRA